MADQTVDDPFDCFGSDKEDYHEKHDSEETTKINKSETTITIRDPDCGVCSQLNAEKSLLIHVQNELKKIRLKPNNKNDNTLHDNDDYDHIIHIIQNVQTIIDDFCNRRAWMMHIGEKAVIVQNALINKINDFIQRRNKNIAQRNDKGQTLTFNCVELGTYCGYGSICIAKILLDFKKIHEDIDFHLYTIELNPNFVKIAQEVITICKLNKYITILENEFMIDGTVGDVGLLLKEGMNNHNVKCYGDTVDDKQLRIDFLFIDHDKDSYLSDLQKLEKTQFIRKGTVVVADNVIFAKIDNYVSYMKDLSENGIVDTETVESIVEYSQPDVIYHFGQEDLFRDGIGTFIFKI